MATVLDYIPGTPCWLDLGTPDLAETAQFYTALFGWTAADQGAEMGHYTVFTLRGRQVAAAVSNRDDDSTAAWTVYIGVEDADATDAAVIAAGGTVRLAAGDVADLGRTSRYADPTGARFAVWQPKAHRGAQLVNEANTWSWSELLTRDTDAAISFYRAVFGWGIRQDPDYAEWQHEGGSMGGLLTMPAMIPAAVPPFWLPYVAVKDVDAALDEAVQLGGSVRVAAQDIPDGRFGVLADPHDAGLGVLRLSATA